MANPKILFVHNGLTSFLKIDWDILAEKNEVEELALTRKFRLNPFAIWKAVQRNDLLFIWFASWHSLLPVIFANRLGKKTILVTGGYDTANVPEAKYGNQRNWFKRVITKYILKNASHIVCNSQYTRQETIKVGNLNPDKVSMIYHGIPDAGIHPLSKVDMALNVGNVFEENLLRKGILPFLAAGQLMPSYRFVQAGAWKDNSYKKLQKYVSANVELKGFVKKEELNQLFAQSRVYIQPSLHEGFGLSVIEAMQAGCIPIISQRGSLPEVVGKFGIVLDDTSPRSIVKAIAQVDEYPFTTSEIREFVLSNYNLEKRKKGLLNCINAITSPIDTKQNLILV